MENVGLLVSSSTEKKKEKDLATDKKTDLVALSASWYCCLLMEWGDMGVL